MTLKLMEAFSTAYYPLEIDLIVPVQPPQALQKCEEGFLFALAIRQVLGEPQRGPPTVAEQYMDEF